MKKLLYILPIVLLMGFNKPSTSNKHFFLKEGVTVEFGDSGIIINNDTLRHDADYKDIKRIIGTPDKSNKSKKEDIYLSEGITVGYETAKMEKVKSLGLVLNVEMANFMGVSLFSGNFILLGEEVKLDIEYDELVEQYEEKKIEHDLKIEEGEIHSMIKCEKAGQIVRLGFIKGKLSVIGFSV